MKNLYQEFFQLFREYLSDLGVDSENKRFLSCSPEEIQSLEEKIGPLPTAYVEYLKSIGNSRLFMTMDAESMAFKYFDHNQSYGETVFAKNNFEPKRPYLVISERRYDYMTFLYLDEGDNPKTWIMSESWDQENDGDNLQIRSNSFTELITYFFGNAVLNSNPSYGFNREEESTQELIHEKHQNWLRMLKSIKERIDSNKSTNELVKTLNNEFLDFYRSNEESINVQLSGIDWNDYKKTKKEKQKIRTQIEFLVSVRVAENGLRSLEELKNLYLDFQKLGGEFDPIEETIFSDANKLIKTKNLSDEQIQNTIFSVAGEWESKRKKEKDSNKTKNLIKTTAIICSIKNVDFTNFYGAWKLRNYRHRWLWKSL